jgi:anti-sigma-K factor RskA
MMAETKPRFIRIGDDAWDKAMERAYSENTNVSELVRTWVEQYAAGDAGYEPASVSEELRLIAARLSDVQKRVAV